MEELAAKIYKVLSRLPQYSLSPNLDSLTGVGHIVALGNRGTDGGTRFEEPTRNAAQVSLFWHPAPLRRQAVDLRSNRRRSNGAIT
jgi:hypothetical protein